MVKRWISAIAVMVLLLSLFGGMGWFAAADSLPEPYLRIDTASGETISNCVVSHSAGIRLTPHTIDGENGFGIKLTGDWLGFWTSGRFLKDLPEGDGACLLVEYYVTEPVLDDQLFRIMPAGNVTASGDVSEGEQWINYFTRGRDGEGLGNDKIVLGQRGVVVYCYTAEQIAALADSEFTVGVRGCPGGADHVYIQSVRLVNAKYVASADRGYAFYNTVESPVSDYYPTVSDMANCHMTRHVLEVSEEFEGYAYYKVYGAPTAVSRTENKLIYLKLFAAEGCENETVRINEYEISVNGAESDWSHGAGAPDIAVSMQDGVGDAFLMGCFNNTLNGWGSLRFRMSEAAKFSRIEVYDAGSYCTSPQATEELRKNSMRK